MRNDIEPRLAFEAPIHEMEIRLVDMESQYAKNRTGGDTTRIAEQIRRLRRELAALEARDLFEPRPLADRPGLSPPEPAADTRLHRTDLRAVRGTARRSCLR